MNYFNKKLQLKKEYIYEYQYIKSNADSVMYKFNPPFYSDGSKSKFNNWELSKENSKSTITSIRLKTLKGSVDNNQTPIMYEYFSNNEKITEEITGLINNDGFIWFHPPRTKGFAILELTPFPYIKFNTRKWKQTIDIEGEVWGNSKWKLWKGKIKTTNKYKNCGYKIISTKIGKLFCTKVEAKSQSKLGKSELLFYYSKEYGFVKFEYILINGDKLNINLVKVID